jgi:hypothetical protein
MGRIDYTIFQGRVLFSSHAERELVHVALDITRFSDPIGLERWNREPNLGEGGKRAVNEVKPAGLNIVARVEIGSNILWERFQSNIQESTQVGASPTLGSSSHTQAKLAQAS